MKKALNIAKWVGLSLLFVLGLIKLGLFIVFCQSSFVTTLYVYGVVAAIMWVAYKKRVLSDKLTVMGYALLGTLLMAEAILRYWVGYPVTYSEMSGGGYNSIYSHNTRFENFYFLTIKGRNDLHTLQYDAGEIMNNTTAEHSFADDTMNELGFRGDAPKKGSRVVASLGDSFTEGAGAGVDSTYPALLQQLLREKGTGVELVNAGTAGNDPFFDYKMLQKLSRIYNVETAIFMINSTDINDVACRGGIDRFMPNGRLQYRPSPWWEHAYAISYVCRLFMHNAMGIGWDLTTAEESKARQEEAITAIGHLFADSVVSWAMTRNIRVVVVLHPLQHELAQANGQYEALAKCVGAVKGITFVDTRSSFTDDRNLDKYYWPLDRHYNAEGYRKLATTIFREAFNSKTADSAHSYLQP